MSLYVFIDELVSILSASLPGLMLNQTICKSYYSTRNKISQTKKLTTLVEGKNAENEFKGSPALYQVNGADFIQQTELQEEVFGPSSLIVLCDDLTELEAALESLEGQLTGSIFGIDEELKRYSSIADILQQKVGRLIFNSVPTGVEVCDSMVHGGPFPATTDSRTTSVGTDAIRRFVRPVCYQDCPSDLLPLYLQNANEAFIMRKINGVLTRDSIQ
jgi:NADP-dependent aldehyde dehydrogenase